MTILERIQTFFETLDIKTWYRLIALYLAILVVLCAGVLFLYYRTTSRIINTMSDINDARMNVRSILKKAQRVYSQRAEVNKIIKEDPDFILPQYLQEVMNKTGIAAFLNTINATQIDREEQFRETIATVTFSGTTMHHLAEFLQIIDQNKRLYTKELEVSRSKKTPHSIDVTVVITTMQPRQTSPG